MTNNENDSIKVGSLCKITHPVHKYPLQPIDTNGTQGEITFLVAGNVFMIFEIVERCMVNEDVFFATKILSGSGNMCLFNFLEKDVELVKSED